MRSLSTLTRLALRLNWIEEMMSACNLTAAQVLYFDAVVHSSHLSPPSHHRLYHRRQAWSLIWRCLLRRQRFLLSRVLALQNLPTVSFRTGPASKASSHYQDLQPVASRYFDGEMRSLYLDWPIVSVLSAVMTEKLHRGPQLLDCLLPCHDNPFHCTPFQASPDVNGTDPSF